VETNPLRVLDSKAPEEQEVIAGLPRITDHLCEGCRRHFAEVRHHLDLLDVHYRVEPRLVRGLDYYTRTTFEVTTGRLGAQNSVLGGGRYDGLVRELGGPDLAAIGFALGLERVVMLLGSTPARRRCDVFLAPLVAEGVERAVLLQRDLRRAGIGVLMGQDARGLKSQMKRADKLAARFVVLLGEEELRRGVLAVRDMEGSLQQEVDDRRVLEYLKEKLHG
jgi:histidyl-tRNA synthetase